MMPIANSAKAKLPAIGRSASAAWSAEAIWVTPCLCSVEAVAMTMNSATRLVTAMPEAMSSRSRLSAPLAWRACMPSGFSCVRCCSSTSCPACQKNKYGLIVVPNSATSAIASSLPNCAWGSSNAWNTSLAWICATNGTATYANSDSVVHLRMPT